MKCFHNLFFIIGVLFFCFLFFLPSPSLTQLLIPSVFYPIRDHKPSLSPQALHHPPLAPCPSIAAQSVPVSAPGKKSQPIFTFPGSQLLWSANPSIYPSSLSHSLIHSLPVFPQFQIFLHFLLHSLPLRFHPSVLFFLLPVSLFLFCLWFLGLPPSF